MHLYATAFVVQNSIMGIRKFNSCFEDYCDLSVCRNVCAHYATLWMNVLANSMCTISVMFVRPRNTLKCLNDTNRLLSMRLTRYSFSPAHWIVLPFVFIQVNAFLLHWSNSLFSRTFLLTFGMMHLTQCVPQISEHIIAIVLHAVESAYRDVNRKIDELNERRVEGGRRGEEVGECLAYLRRYHWAVTDVTELISDTFSLDFITVGVCTAIRFMYYLFLTLQSEAKNSLIGVAGGIEAPSYQAVIFCVTVIGKFAYLCYRCDRIGYEVSL